MNCKCILIIVLVFWFGSDVSTSRGKEEDPLSIQGSLLSSEHHHVERRQSILKGLGLNPILTGLGINPCIHIGSLSLECRMYQWQTMKGSNTALNDYERNYFNSFGSTGKPPIISGPIQPISKPKLRKEYRCLTDLERQNLHDALNAMKFTLIGNQTEYDIFVLYHTYVNAPEAHWGPAFCGFHREYLLR